MTKKLSSTACIRLLPGDVMRFVLPGCHPIEGLCLGAPLWHHEISMMLQEWHTIWHILTSLTCWILLEHGVGPSTVFITQPVVDAHPSFLPQARNMGEKAWAPTLWGEWRKNSFRVTTSTCSVWRCLKGCLAPKRRFRNFKLQFWKGVSHKTCFWEIADVRNRMVVKTKRKSRTKMCFWMFLRDSRCTKTYVFEEEMCLEQSKSRCEELRRTEKSWEDVKRTKWTEKAISRASAPRTGFARHPIGTFIGFNMFNWRWVVQAYAWHSSGTTRRCSGRGKLGSSILTAVAITSPYVPWSKHRL